MIKSYRIDKTRFAKRISYSGPNEDSRSELRALNITEDDTVLGITGAGDRLLSLLVNNPKKLIAIDVNPSQNYLLELKIAAIKELNRERFMAFMGISSCSNRIQIYGMLRHQLSAEARRFWDENLSSIKEGVFFKSALEKHFSLLGRLLRVFRKKRVQELLSFTNLKEQKEFFDQKWNTLGWRLFIHFTHQKFIFKFLLKDPGFYEFVPKDTSIPKYLVGRLHKSLQHHVVSENFFTTFLLSGSYRLDTALPFYLKTNNYEKIQDVLKNKKIEIVNGLLEEYLQSHSGTIDKFSISDVSAYLPRESFLSLMDAIYTAGSETSAFCMRHFITKRNIPDALQNKFEFDKDLEKVLDDYDHSFVYSFNVARKLPISAST